MSGNLYLIGFMGAGKSTVGRAVADRLGLPFVDLDEAIESRASRSIADVFETDGEAAFRRMEHDELLRVSAADQTVVACGGGIVALAENVAVLRRTGVVVYLESDIGTTTRRVVADGVRPLMADDPGTVEGLLEARRPLYEDAADVRIDATTGSLGEVVERVLAGVSAS